MPESCLAMPLLIFSAKGVRRKPRFMAMWTRAGSTVTSASSPLRETESVLSSFQLQEAPSSRVSFSVAPARRFFASSTASWCGMSTSYLGMGESLSRHAGGGTGIEHQAGDLDLVHGQAEQRPLAVQQRLALEQVIGAHPVARRRLAVRLLSRHAGDDQDLLPGLQHEAGVDHPQHRAAFPRPAADDLQAAGVHRGGAGVLQDEPLFVDSLL